MKIGIVGGGPAGLYFSLLMKQHHPGNEIFVVEQNPAGATYGWGVVFSDNTLTYLEDNDRPSYEDVTASMQTWDDVVVAYRDERIRVGGNTFSGIARIDLLGILQEHCQRAGVAIDFEKRLTDLHGFDGFDLIVGADGLNSMVRELFQENFGASVNLRPNKFIWYGSEHLFDGLTLTFRQSEHGYFAAHSYRYSKTLSTFIVECEPQTWSNAAFESKSDEENRAYLEAVFQADLGGKPLLSNKSDWINFSHIQNQHWRHNNIVLLGDALHTAHFSIGSGTKMALEDAIALYHALTTSDDVSSGLAKFEAARRPITDRLQAAAMKSMQWFEQFGQRMHQQPMLFAYDVMTRSGKVDRENLLKRDPDFVAAYERSIP